jgi:quinone-modifying oxidoreductase, subunit QmoC
MASASSVSPDPEFRSQLMRLSSSAARCYQCATCSSVCNLTAAEAPFPRRQMLWAQWGLVDRLMADPSVWLCHQCNDCNPACPRDARPGDTLQAIRALMIERAGAPRFLSRLVGGAASTWPLLVGLPILFWAVLIYLVTGYSTSRSPLVYGDVVPHWLIYAVFFPAFGYATAAATVGARRAWRSWGSGAQGSGSMLAGLAGVATEVLAHRRFKRCEAARPRQAGHLSLFWGFVGAATTSGLLVVAMYGFGKELPLPQVHPIKILGNISAVLLVVGVGWLAVNRLTREAAGASKPFDRFFMGLVLGVVFTGVIVELGRYLFPVWLAVGLYVVHLGIVLSLFLTFPYSKFAHALYRTLAMAHEHQAARPRTP